MKHIILLSSCFCCLVILVGCMKNEPPEIPTTIIGPSSGYPDSIYSFATKTKDPDGDEIAYQFLWGDGDTSNWSNFVPSDSLISMTHSYTNVGNYAIQVRAQDINKAFTEWSTAHTISINPVPLSWAKTFGGNDFDYGWDVKQTSDGGYIIIGYTESFGAVGIDIYLVKTDANGNLMWQKTYGSVSEDEGFSVAQTSDNGYILVGHTNSYGTGSKEIYLIKTDANGNEQWFRLIGGNDADYGRCVKPTPDKGYIVAGYTSTNSAGYLDIYITKLDSLGIQQWFNRAGSTGYEYGYSVDLTNDKGYIVVGSTTSFGAGANDVYLVKFDSVGDLKWTKTFGGSSSDYGYSIKQTLDGGFIIAGSTASYGAGLQDVYLIKTDANGNSVWQKTFGGSADDYGYSVALTNDGGYIIAGSTISTGGSYNNVYLIKTDASGNLVWSKSIGGGNYDYGRSVMPTQDGGYVIVGSTKSYGAGEYDVYLIKTDASGNVK